MLRPLYRRIGSKGDNSAIRVPKGVSGLADLTVSFKQAPYQLLLP